MAAVLARRKKWLESGTPWFDPKARPPDWDLQAQLRDIPAHYRG
jgi:hypothetical protein